MCSCVGRTRLITYESELWQPRGQLSAVIIYVRKGVCEYINAKYVLLLKKAWQKNVLSVNYIVSVSIRPKSNWMNINAQ